MDSTVEVTRILAGSRDEYGIPGRVVVIPPSQAADVPSPSRLLPADGDALAVAPFLTLQVLEERHFILVGRVHVCVPAAGLPAITVVIQEAWQARSPRTHAKSEEGSWRGWRKVEESKLFVSVVERALSRPGHKNPSGHVWRAITVAKAIAEHSRQAVAGLRELRYQAERDFGHRLTGHNSSNAELADLIELSIAASRARDIARDAAREGLWIWHTDKDAYHVHRRRLDPTLAARKIRSKSTREPWFATFDAGARQCTEMASSLDAEIEQLHRLLEAASTISVARDAQAQEHFNFVAAVGAVLLGLPALVLAVYGSAAPDWREDAWRWPLGLSAVGAVVFAWFLTKGTRRLQRSGLVALAAMFVLAVVLLAAGLRSS